MPRSCFTEIRVYGKLCRLYNYYYTYTTSKEIDASNVLLYCMLCMFAARKAVEKERKGSQQKEESDVFVSNSLRNSETLSYHS